MLSTAQSLVGKGAGDCLVFILLNCEREMGHLWVVTETFESPGDWPKERLGCSDSSLAIFRNLFWFGNHAQTPQPGPLFINQKGFAGSGFGLRVSKVDYPTTTHSRGIISPGRAQNIPTEYSYSRSKGRVGMSGCRDAHEAALGHGVGVSSGGGCWAYKRVQQPKSACNYRFKGKKC